MACWPTIRTHRAALSAASLARVQPLSGNVLAVRRTLTVLRGRNIPSSSPDLL